MDLGTTLRKVNELVDEYRSQCLWFLRKDYYPRTTSDARAGAGHFALTS